jgi:hypothetical protein
MKNKTAKIWLYDIELFVKVSKKDIRKIFVDSVKCKKPVSGEISFTPDAEICYITFNRTF